MATLIQRLEAAAKHHGAEVDHDADDCTLHVWAPANTVWADGRTSVLAACYTNGTQRWMRKAVDDLIERMADGTEADPDGDGPIEADPNADIAEVAEAAQRAFADRGKYRASFDMLPRGAFFTFGPDGVKHAKVTATKATNTQSGTTCDVDPGRIVFTDEPVIDCGDYTLADMAQRRPLPVRLFMATGADDFMGSWGIGDTLTKAVDNFRLAGGKRVTSVYRFESELPLAPRDREAVDGECDAWADGMGTIHWLRCRRVTVFDHADPAAQYALAVNTACKGKCKPMTLVTDEAKRVPTEAAPTNTDVGVPTEPVMIGDMRPSHVHVGEGVDGFHAEVIGTDGECILGKVYTSANTARLQAGRMAKRYGVRVESDLVPSNAGG